MNSKIAYRGQIFSFRETATLENLPINKFEASQNKDHYLYIEDGVLIVENGKIISLGNYTDLKDQLSDTEIINYKNYLLTPGFIDTHIHSVQTGIVAAYGEKLLEWLQEYVFPEESKYADEIYAIEQLNFFIDQLIRHGTTTAVAYGPLFYNACDIFFELLRKKNLRFITGNVLMDKNSPDSLCLSTQENYDNCQKLINKWHNKDRLSYCITPRFALSCTGELLELCGSLHREYPDCYIQTHLNENPSEVTQIKKDFPWSKNYLDIYNHFGLVTDKSVFGHCIYNRDEELELIKKSGAIISWCPVSNNFLGSGLFSFSKARKFTDKITLGTDWGGGNSLCMLKVFDDAYKVSMLNNTKLPAMICWYLATLGPARCLQLDNFIGTLTPGKEADFLVIDPDASPLLKYRRSMIDNITDLLFLLMTLGSEINIKATYVGGKPAYIKRDNKE